MKKIILLGSVVFLISSCVSIQKQTALKTQTGDYIVSIEWNYDLKLTTVAIDSCEYLAGIIGYDTRTTVLTHKGNCKYCAARLSKHQ
jgi:hypothetical protein